MLAQTLAQTPILTLKKVNEKSRLNIPHFSLFNLKFSDEIVTPNEKRAVSFS